MEITFCDRCDSSIPRADLDGGSARQVAGEILCSRCRSEVRRSRLLTLALVPLALLAAGAVGAAAAVLVLRPRIQEMEAKVLVLREASASAKTDPALIEELKGILEIDRGQARAITELRETLLENSDELSKGIQELSRHVVFLAEEIRAIKEHLVEAAEPPAEEEVDGSEEPLTPAEPPPADLETWLPRMTDSDPGVRLSALLAVGTARDERVNEKILAALADADSIVRAQAAELLGERNVAKAVPFLIDRLEDQSIGVRDKAFRSLVALTGADHGYDPTDPEAARQKAVTAFREWWKER